MIFKNGLTIMPRPYPKPEKKERESIRRKRIEKHLEALSKELVNWRDKTCVLSEIDGGRCSQLLQWGHLIPQGTSPWMVYVIGNTFKQCSTHNFLHHHKDPVFSDWYTVKFGAGAWHSLCREQRAHIGISRKVWELEEMVEHYEYMLENRPSLHTLELLIELGYYGEWCKSGL
jgi:hypothetical protein